MISAEIPCPRRTEFEQNQCNAIFTGVVKHALKTSAGRSADCGKISFAPHAAIKIHSFAVLVTLVGPKPESPASNFGCACSSSANAKDRPIWRRAKSKPAFVVGGDIFGAADGSDSFKKDLTINPALEQSKT